MSSQRTVVIAAISNGSPAARDVGRQLERANEVSLAAGTHVLPIRQRCAREDRDYRGGVREGFGSAVRARIAITEAAIREKQRGWQAGRSLPSFRDPGSFECIQPRRHRRHRHR
jgi:hypothetical protein